MTKQEKQTWIIEEIKALGDVGFGDYRYVGNLKQIICDAMGWRWDEGYYKVPGCFGKRRWEFRCEHRDEVDEVIRRMAEKRIIILSKTNGMFKLNV